MRPELRFVQIDPDAAEQRIGRTPQVAHQGADPAPLDQPPPAARLPHTAGLAHHGVVVLRAAHSRPRLTEGAELAWADLCRQRQMDQRPTRHASDATAAPRDCAGAG